MSLGVLGFLQNTIRLDVTGEWARIIHVSVGGSMFTVSRNVFKLYEDHPFFGKLCDDSMRKDSDGCTVIDRDGTMFRHILNFIRSESTAHDRVAELQQQQQNQQQGSGGGGGGASGGVSAAAVPPVLGKLLLPDHFDEWDLLLEEVNYYQLPSLQQAIVNDERYKMRQWRRSLPGAVYVNWKEMSVATAAQQQPRLQVSMIPDLPFMQVTELAPAPTPMPPTTAPAAPAPTPTVGASPAAAAPPAAPASTAAPSSTQQPPGQCITYQGGHQILNVHELAYYMLNVFDLKVNHWQTTNNSNDGGSVNTARVEHHIHFIRNTPMVIPASSAGGM